MPRATHRPAGPHDEGSRMALTRKMLKAMGIEDDKADQIIEAHAESVDALKKQRDDAKAEADSVPELRKQLEEAQKAAAGDDAAERLKSVQDEFAAYKADVEAKEARATAERLFREQLRAAKVDDRYADLAVKDMDPSQYAVKDGTFEDADAVEKAVAGFAEKYPQFITSTSTQGASTGNPPANSGGQAEPSSLRDALRQRYSEKG